MGNDRHVADVVLLVHDGTDLVHCEVHLVGVESTLLSTRVVKFHGKETLSSKISPRLSFIHFQNRSVWNKSSFKQKMEGNVKTFPLREQSFVKKPQYQKIDGLLNRNINYF